MPKRSKLSESDLNDLKNAMIGVKPLTKNKERIKKHFIPPPSPQKNKFIKEDNDIQILESDSPLEQVSSETRLSFHQPEIANKILRKLQKGQYNVEAKLDLHGLTVEEARITIKNFLENCTIKGVRVVLIIHGKGHHGRAPTLKNKLNYWLRNLHDVLAFCSAGKEHGCRGAVYVLLRHKREE